MVDGVAVVDSVLDPHVLVLPVVILNGDGEPNRGKAKVEELGVVPAAAETVIAPHLADVEANVEPVSELVEIARDVARRRVILAAEAALLSGERVMRLPARPFGENPNVGGIAQPVRPAAVADDV